MRRKIKFFVIVALNICLVLIAALAINISNIEEKNLFHPDEDVSLTPKSVGLPFEDIYFKTKDGETLNGWFIPAKDAELTILYCQGNAGNLSDRFNNIVFFHDMGVNLFIFDYRGYGNSTGEPSEQGLYRDARGAYDYLASRADIERDKIVIYGRSLGGAVAADLCLRRKAAALVLVSSFVSLKVQAKDLYPHLPVEFLLWGKFNTFSKIKKITIPKLIVHGTNDEVVSFRQAELLYGAAPLPKQFLPFLGGHDDEIFVTSQAYKYKLLKFFDDNDII